MTTRIAGTAYVHSDSNASLSTTLRSKEGAEPRVSVKPNPSQKNPTLPRRVSCMNLSMRQPDMTHASLKNFQISNPRLQVPFTTQDLANKLGLNIKSIVGAFVFGSHAWTANQFSKSDWDVCVVVDEPISVIHKRSHSNFTLDATVIGKNAFLEKVERHDFHYITLALLPEDCVVTNKMKIKTALSHEKLEKELAVRRDKDAAKIAKFKAKGKHQEAEKIARHVERMEDFYRQIIQLPQVSISKIDSSISLQRSSSD